MPSVVAADPAAAAVLSKALLRAADRLAVPQRGLARVLGVSEATVSRMARGRGLAPPSKEGELALLFLRLFRSLDAYVGGDEAAARIWFHAPNAHLGGVPAELVQTAAGLVGVVGYLDALRGRG